VRVPEAACGHLKLSDGPCALCPARAPEPPRALPSRLSDVSWDWDLVEAESCRRSLAKFVRAAWGHCSLAATPLEWGDHIEAICHHIQGQLEDAARRRGDPSYKMRAQRLLINCPPRSLKTVCLTLANAWAWIRWPNLEILYLSINPNVVLDSARLFRDVVSGAWYQRLFVRGAWQIRDDQDALSSMGNTAGGARRAKGFRSEIIGANSSWTCIDDAHAMDDTEDTIRDTIANYDLNVSSRLNDPRTGILTAIMQRARRRDFSEHVVAQGWFHLRMPMSYEARPECRCPQCGQGSRREANAFGWVDKREEGDVLHPRYTPEYLEDRRKVLRHHYAGQMQQRPADREGDVFKKVYWRFAQIDGDGKPRERFDGAREDDAYVLKRRASGELDVDWVCLSVDPTGGSTSATASALGMVVIAGKGERRFILADLTPGPRTWNDTKKDLRAALIATAKVTGWTRKILVLVEKKALGAGAIQELEAMIGDGVHDARGRAIHAKVEAYEPSGKGSKEARADFLEPMADDGLLFLLDGAPWLRTPPEGSDDTLVDEFAAFPRGDRDDRVDVVAQCLDRFRSGGLPTWVRYFSDKPTAPSVVPPKRPDKAHECYFVDGRCIRVGHEPEKSCGP
jgi:phage terminase large subunit-like protein